MSRSRAEQETIVRFSADPEEPMTVYTFKASLARKLRESGASVKRTTTDEGREVAWTLECPQRWFRAPRKPSGRKGRPGGNPTALQNAHLARKAKQNSRELALTPDESE